MICKIENSISAKKTTIKRVTPLFAHAKNQSAFTTTKKNFVYYDKIGCCIQQSLVMENKNKKLLLQ